MRKELLTWGRRREILSRRRRRVVVKIWRRRWEVLGSRLGRRTRGRGSGWEKTEEGDYIPA